MLSIQNMRIKAELLQDFIVLNFDNFIIRYRTHMIFLVAQLVKNLPAAQETRVQSLFQQDSTPVLLPGKSFGQRSLVDYTPWGHKSRTLRD